MNTSFSLDKASLKDFLLKRENCREDEIKYISIPYSINLFNNGIENFFSKYLTISTSNKFLLCYHAENTGNIRLYNYNNPEIIELNINRNKKNDGLGFVYKNAIESTGKNFKSGFNSVIKDDLDFPGSSLAVKTSSMLYALHKSNNMELNSDSLIKTLENINKKFLNLRVNNYDLLGVINKAQSEEFRSYEKVNWSELKDLKILQIIINKSQADSGKLQSELEKASNLLKVLLASKKLKDISEIDKDELMTFLKRLPKNQQDPIIFLYNQTAFINQSIKALKSKNISEFINIINCSNEYVAIFGNKTLFVWEKLKYIKGIVAATISINDGNIICFIKNKDEGRIKLEISKILENIQTNFSDIENIFISEKS